MRIKIASFVIAVAMCGTQTSAQNVSAVPQFQVDPFWPKPLPNNWILGQVSGIATDRFDRIWVVHRPASLTMRERAAELGGVCVIEARDGHMSDAVTLWESAFQRAPGRSGIGMNLAYAFCGTGKPEQAREFTMRVLQFNPDLDAAKKLLRALNATPPKCAM